VMRGGEETSGWRRRVEKRRAAEWSKERGGKGDEGIRGDEGKNEVVNRGSKVR
jgi:hypothetical protein